MLKFIFCHNFLFVNIRTNGDVMPRDFKTFAKEHENIAKENPEKVSEYQDILNKYKNMNQNELMANLFEQASKLKSEGKLDSSTLNSLKSSLSMFLNDEQKHMLNDIIDAINGQK